jgi:hypothetical protein
MCPSCGLSCKRVEHRTLYHQVRFPENSRLGSGTYFFCLSKECAVGYFLNTGHIILKQHLRTYQEIGDDKLCYCFDINTEHYLSALNANNADVIKNFVIQGTKSGDCACDIKNPSGQCCLAKFRFLEQHVFIRNDVE